jgi:hypothetical protein
MKRCCLFLPLVLIGCGVSGNTAKPTANYQRFNPDAVTNPTVLIIGDSIVNAWCSAALLAQNPTWACQGSPAGVPMETSTEVLARFPRALSASPKTIVIEVGVWDIENFVTNEPASYIGDDNYPCGNPGYPPPPSPTPCENIQQMVTEATNAGIQVIVCTIPPWGDGAAATSTSDLEMVDHDSDIVEFNRNLLAMTGTVDMYTQLETFPAGDGAYIYYDFSYYYTYTDNGVTPNTAGGNAMTLALQSALASQALRLR